MDISFGIKGKLYHFNIYLAIGMFFEFASHAGIKVESVKFDFLSNKQYHTSCL